MANPSKANELRVWNTTVVPSSEKLEEFLSHMHDHSSNDEIITIRFSDEEQQQPLDYKHQVYIDNKTVHTDLKVQKSVLKKASEPLRSLMTVPFAEKGKKLFACPMKMHSTSMLS